MNSRSGDITEKLKNYRFRDCGDRYIFGDKICGDLVTHLFFFPIRHIGFCSPLDSYKLWWSIFLVTVEQVISSLFGSAMDVIWHYLSAHDSCAIMHLCRSKYDGPTFVYSVASWWWPIDKSRRHTQKKGQSWPPTPSSCSARRSTSIGQRKGRSSWGCLVA